MINENEMARMVRRAIEGYFRDLDGEKPCAVYDMVINCVEKPLLESVLHSGLSVTAGFIHEPGVERTDEAPPADTDASDTSV